MKKLISLLLSTIVISLLLIHCSDDNDEPPIILKYTLTTEAKPAEGGSISPASGSYEKGSNVSIKATPANGYIFIKWTGGVTGDSNPVSLIMNTDKKVVAEFEKILPKTYVIEDVDWSNNIVSINETDFTFVFNSKIKEKYEIKEGDFLVGTLNGGYLRKISKITESNNQITLKTEFASITEAFEELHEEVNSGLKIDFNHPDFWMHEGVTVSENAAKGQRIENQMTIGLNGVFFDFDENLETEGDQIRLEGSYTLGAGLEMELDISIHKLKKLEIGFPLKQSTNLTGYIGTGANFEKEISLIKIPCHDIPVGLVIIQPVIEIKGGVAIDLESSLQIEYSHKRNSYTQMVYDGNDWTKTKSLTEENGFKDPEISSEVKAKLYIKPEIKFKIYRTVSPYVDAEFAAKVETEINQDNLFWKAYLGWGLGVGVKMKIWKESLFDFYFKPYEDEVLIKEGQYFEGEKTYVPDDNFEKALIRLGYDYALDDYVLNSNIENLKSLDLSGNNIEDLTGISSFKNLEILNVMDNQLKMLDVSKNYELKDLTCHYNQLTNLDLTNNLKLEELRCVENKLTLLKFDNGANLKYINCSDNQLTSLDVTNHYLLDWLIVKNNQLTYLDLRKMERLSKFNCENNQLTSFDVSKTKLNPEGVWDNIYAKGNNIQCVQVNQTQLSKTPGEWEFDSNPTFSLDCTTNNDDPLDPNGLTPAINNLVPQSILDEMKNLGMTINTGASPPTINKSYLVSPLVLIGSNISGDGIGSTFDDLNFKLSNQNSTDLTIDLDYKQGNGTGNGLGSFIVGGNNLFSVFAEVISTDASTGAKAKSTMVLSGKIVSNGIDNFKLAIFMIDNYGNPNNNYIDNGQGRVFHDSDKFSEIISSFKTSNGKIILQNNLKGLLDK